VFDFHYTNGYTVANNVFSIKINKGLMLRIDDKREEVSYKKKGM